ncbi:MAG TPA: methionyl-tRNA formyltransferase, partial [Pyrinomonadaceae bacterium]
RLIHDGHEIGAVYTQPDRPSGRGNKITFSPVKQLALDKGLPVLQPAKIKTPEAFEEFRSHNADVAVVVAYGRILPESFLTVYPNGAINVHFSLLPKYHGAAPVNWAIVNGETVTGVTTMNMDAGLDTGDILLQRKTAIGSEENSIELMDRLAGIGADLLSETLKRLPELEPRPQDDSLATMAPIMTKEDGRFAWAMPADQIARMVRGFQPFPTTFTYYGGKKLTIWSSSPTEIESHVVPGTVIVASGDQLLIKCGGASVLKIVELQLEGKRRMNVRDFLNGVTFKVGDVIE